MIYNNDTLSFVELSVVFVELSFLDACHNFFLIHFAFFVKNGSSLPLALGFF